MGKILLIVGAGQYGLVAKDIAEEMGCFLNIIFLDDCRELAAGKISDINKINYNEAIVAMGNPEVRSKLLAQIPNNKTATLIHPKATIMPSAMIGKGTIVEAGAVISPNAEIGKGCIIMANAVVGHNAKVGECCQLKYNCTASENCVVPGKTKIDCNVVFNER